MCLNTISMHKIPRRAELLLISCDQWRYLGFSQSGPASTTNAHVVLNKNEFETPWSGHFDVTNTVHLYTIKTPLLSERYEPNIVRHVERMLITFHAKPSFHLNAGPCCDPTSPLPNDWLVDMFVVLLHIKALWVDPHTPPAFHLKYFRTHLVRDRGFFWAGRRITWWPSYATGGIVEFLTDGWVPVEFFVGAKWSLYVLHNAQQGCWAWSVHTTWPT